MQSTSYKFSTKIIAATLGGFFLLLTNIAQADITVNEIFNQLGFSEQEKQAVLSGKLIKRMLKKRSDHEMAVAVAFKLNKNSEQLRKDFLKGLFIDKPDDIVSYQFISPDADFPELQLTAKEQQEMGKFLAAEPGNTLNLSADEIKAFNELAKTDALGSAAILTQLHHLLKSRYKAYRQGGPALIAPYQRSASKQYKLGDYLSKNRQEILPTIRQSFPEFYKALNNYPQYKPTGLQERFILLKMNIQGQLAFALEHRMALQENGAEVMAVTYFYVSHTLNGQQGLGMLIPNSEESIVVQVTRASSDAVAGFGSSVKYFIGRRMLGDSISGFYQSVQKNYMQ